MSGTHTLRDVWDDLKIPFHQVHHAERYHQALAKLSPGIRTVVGHSLGGAVAARLTEDHPNIQARVYGAPLARWTKNPRVQDYRHDWDPVSMLDRSATTTPAKGWNPHSYGGYRR